MPSVLLLCVCLLRFVSSGSKYQFGCHFVRQECNRSCKIGLMSTPLDGQVSTDARTLMMLVGCLWPIRLWRT